MKYFGKLAKFTKTFANNAPLSDCTKLCRCMQGHLNFHLSSTLLVLNGIDNLNATEILRKTVNSSTFAKVTLREMCLRTDPRCSYSSLNVPQVKSMPLSPTPQKWSSKQRGSISRWQPGASTIGRNQIPVVQPSIVNLQTMRSIRHSFTK